MCAGLRGVPRDSVVETVNKWLESVDLHNVQDQYSSGFSGGMCTGMRRRLSLACATIDGRPLLILDEPTTCKYSSWYRLHLSALQIKTNSYAEIWLTLFVIKTGMDPVGHRFVWKHTDELKGNRVVILTTHAMEEADLLADSVAVSVSWLRGLGVLV